MTEIPTIDRAKSMARQLRRELHAGGVAISHAQALERVAKMHGFRDWNALSAAAHDHPEPGLTRGARVRGSYLSHPFHGTIRDLRSFGRGWFFVELELDQPIDVVRFSGFSNLRRRIRAEIGPGGYSRETTSDGEPHLRLDLVD